MWTTLGASANDVAYECVPADEGLTYTSAFDKKNRVWIGETFRMILTLQSIEPVHAIESGIIRVSVSGKDLLNEQFKLKAHEVRSYPISFDIKEAKYALKVQTEYTSRKFTDDYNRQLTAARGIEVNKKSNDYEIDVVRRIVRLQKKGEWNFSGTPLFKVVNTPKYLEQTGECFIQTYIENVSEQTVHLHKIVFNPDNIEHKVEALHQETSGSDLFDQTATFNKGDKRRYLFKLVSVGGNSSRLALADG